MGQKRVFLGTVRTVGVPATVFLRPVCCPLVALLCDLFVFSRELYSPPLSPGLWFPQ